MKVTYNFGQEFELLEIDMWNDCLIFKTTNGMGKFNEYDFPNRDDEGNVIFKIYFDSIFELQNIPKLLWDYLDDNSLMYWCD